MDWGALRKGSDGRYQIGFRAGGLDLVGRLIRTTPGVCYLPGEPRSRHVDGQWVDGIFASQTLGCAGSFGGGGHAQSVESGDDRYTVHE